MPLCTSNSTALLTDQYELTMLGQRGPTVQHRGAARSRSSPGDCGAAATGSSPVSPGCSTRSLGSSSATSIWGSCTAARRPHPDWLAGYRFRGDIDGYPEGELYFPGSPVLTVTGSFAEAVMLETLVLSILNHDSAVVAAAAGWPAPRRARPLIEMGSGAPTRRLRWPPPVPPTWEVSARRPTWPPAALRHPHHRHRGARVQPAARREADAFAAQVGALGTDTTLLVDTYDITQGITTAIEVAGPGLRAIRIDSGDLGELARQAREQLDRLGAPDVQIVVSGDLDEFSIAALRAEPVDSYGVGTSVVTGSGAPTAGMVYKLVEVDGQPVAKRSTAKVSRGGAKSALRRYKPSGTAVEEVVFLQRKPPKLEPHDRVLPVPLMREGSQWARRRPCRMDVSASPRP